jgi:DNA-binding response OmpR family regulator
VCVQRRNLNNPPGDPIVRIGELVIELATHTVSVSGRRVQLSAKACRLLQILAQHAGNVATHQQLLTEVWGANTCRRDPISISESLCASSGRSSIRIRQSRASS